MSKKGRREFERRQDELRREREEDRLLGWMEFEEELEVNHMINYPIEIDKRIGIVPGNDICIFIVTGRGGTIYGYNNKYINLATELSEHYGYAICVVASPIEGPLELIENMELCMNASSFTEVRYIGISYGALVGAQQGWQIPRISKMLLINGPLMINWHKTKLGAERFKGKEIIFVYGEKDPSYRYFEILKNIDSSVVSLYSVSGADHHFSGMEDEEMELIKYFVS
jgi:hypothetical protein